MNLTHDEWKELESLVYRFRDLALKLSDPDLHCLLNPIWEQLAGLKQRDIDRDANLPDGEAMHAWYSFAAARRDGWKVFMSLSGELIATTTTFATYELGRDNYAYPDKEYVGEVIVPSTGTPIEQHGPSPSPPIPGKKAGLVVGPSKVPLLPEYHEGKPLPVAYCLGCKKSSVFHPHGPDIQHCGIWFKSFRCECGAFLQVQDPEL